MEMNDHILHINEEKYQKKCRRYNIVLGILVAVTLFAAAFKMGEATGRNAVAQAETTQVTETGAIYG